MKCIYVGATFETDGKHIVNFSMTLTMFRAAVHSSILTVNESQAYNGGGSQHGNTIG